MTIDAFFYLDAVRKIALQLPGVTEGTCFGTPAFYAGKKYFARMKETGNVLIIYTEERHLWMKKDPKTFYITDHYKDCSYMLVALDSVRTAELARLIHVAWRNKAAKKLVKEWDTGAGNNNTQPIK